MLLKRCTNSGFSISELAHLSDFELNNKTQNEKLDTNTAPNAVQSFSIAISCQQDLLVQINKTRSLDLVFSEYLSNPATLHLHSTLLQSSPDILVLEVPNINADNVKSITELLKIISPVLSIIIYRFSNQAHSNVLRSAGVRLLRAPLDDGTLYDILSEFIANNTPSEKNLSPLLATSYPSHLYNHKQLAKIANLPTKVDCECPHHLVDLIEGLKAFEKYSGECIITNDLDAALHGKIQLTTAGVRQQLEYLLKEVLNIEGIEI